MVIRGKKKCFACEKDFNWFVRIKDGNIDETVRTMNEEMGIATFTGKNKIEVDVNCPLCRNVNRFGKSLK